LSSSLRAPASSSSITSSARRSRTSSGNSSVGRPSRRRAAPAGRCARPPGSLRNPPPLPVRSLSVLAFVDMTLLFGHAYTELRTLPGRAVDPEANKRLVERFHDEVWTRRNVEFAEQVFADDYVRHDLRPTQEHR